MADELIPFSAIEPIAGLDLFPEIPDYAIDALWLEWGRVRRRKPPANMICTTGAAYQQFCRLAGNEGESFPSVMISKETLLDITMLPAVSYRKGEVQDLGKLVKSWGEEDRNTYVAFIYEGSRYQNLMQAVMQQLAPRYAALQGNG